MKSGIQQNHHSICRRSVTGSEEGNERIEISVSFKPYTTIRNIKRHPKDPLPKEYQSGVIYQINCEECDGEYIGKMSRQLWTRTMKDQADVSLGRAERSALAEHSIATGLKIYQMCIEIMEKEKNWHKKRQNNMEQQIWETKLEQRWRNFGRVI